jgi:hypothetical protein
MARYIFSDSYAATVLPIIREIHREIVIISGIANVSWARSNLSPSARRR